MKPCPCCGQTIRRPTAVNLHRHLRAPAKRLLIRVLARSYPDPVDRDNLVDTMYAGTDMPGDPVNTLLETVRLTRKEVELFGWTIVNDAPHRRARARYRLSVLYD